MIQQIPFGNTGHDSTRTLFGAAALGRVTQKEANETVELLLEHGVNHIDTAASYGQGMSEKNLAQSLAKYRDRFFLATKLAQNRSPDERIPIEGGDVKALRLNPGQIISPGSVYDLLPSA